jgi:phenylacetate-CoA ligase
MQGNRPAQTCWKFTSRLGSNSLLPPSATSDDMNILRGVNVFPTQIEEVLLATDWCGGQFVIELTRERAGWTR